jgi:hypothetical protein
MKLEMNIEHPTSLRCTIIRRSVFDVRCSMFVFAAILFTAPQLFAQTSTNTLPALAPPYGEIPPTFLEQHETTIIVGSFTFLAFAFLFLRAMLRPETPVILPPEILARQALAKLQPQPETGKILSEVSQILRHYLIAAFELPAGELTTAEFCTALATHEKIGPALAKSISNFLHDCDRAKFSKSPAAAPLNAAIGALELVSCAEKRWTELHARIPAAK